MKFALAGYGSRGDVEPLAAVGRELLRRGHEVRIAVPPNLIGFVEAAGLAAVGYGPDPRTLRGDGIAGGGMTGADRNPIMAMMEIMRHFAEALADWGATMTALAEDADALVTAASERALAANVAEHHGIPLITLHYYPGNDSSLGGPLGQLAVDAAAAQRRALGLPENLEPAAPAWEIQAYDEICFPGLAADWADEAGRRPFVGALTLAAPTNVDDEVLSWITAGTPPIYFGFGSNARADPVGTIAVIGAACAELGERALICSGASGFVQTLGADHVKVVGEVNHAAVFPACRAVVHQGGAGTTAAGLRAGAPALILSFQIEDQPIWADAITRLEVGLGREFSATSPQSLAADLRTVLEPQYLARAREVAAQMSNPAESASRVADLLEDAAREGRHL